MDLNLGLWGYQRSKVQIHELLSLSKLSLAA